MKRLPIILIAVATPVLRAPALPAGQPAIIAVNFAPTVTEKLQRYGTREDTTLRSAILTAVSGETDCREIPAGAEVIVMLKDIAPTHPTRQLLANNPALDVVQTKYLGGAELAAEVRDESGHVLAALTYRHFAPDLNLGSSSLDPWADARLAIDQFADKLAATCRDVSTAASRRT